MVAVSGDILNPRMKKNNPTFFMGRIAEISNVFHLEYDHVTLLIHIEAHCNIGKNQEWFNMTLCTHMMDHRAVILTEMSQNRYTSRGIIVKPEDDSTSYQE